jgi:hypothetical protein
VRRVALRSWSALNPTAKSAERYKICFCAEWANNWVKEDVDASSFMAKGHGKWIFHLIFDAVVRLPISCFELMVDTPLEKQFSAPGKSLFFYTLRYFSWPPQIFLLSSMI